MITEEHVIGKAVARGTGTGNFSRLGWLNLSTIWITRKVALGSDSHCDVLYPPQDDVVR